MMLLDIVSGIGYTILITLLALVFGGLIGLPLAAARRSRAAALRIAATAYLDVVRAIPPITWLFLIYFGLPQFQIYLEPIPAAVIGLSVISSGYMAEIYRAGLLSIHSGQWEAAHALGMSVTTRTLSVITPQAYRVCLTAVAVYTIGLLKDSALASTIGVQEITYNAGDAARSSHNGLLAFAIAGALYVLLSIPFAIAARRVDRVLRAKLGIA
jgi:polar amino acid transport system permease protein